MSAAGTDDDHVPLELPETLVTALARLTDAPVHAVGGVVRDAWLGLSIGDWDFATRARPAAIVAALGAAVGPIDVIDALGRVAFVVDGREVVITTFRVEGDYGRDRRPRTVRFVDTPAEDAARRDFTVNAVYVDTVSRRVVDPTGGLPDLRARRLRTIGDPVQRFAEDPLRMLRAIRFEASRGLHPTASTAIALAELAPRVAALQPERRLDELRRALVEPRASGAILRALDTGLLGHAVPALAGHAHRVRQEAVPLLAELVGAGEADAFAALLLDGDVAAAALGELRAPRTLQQAVGRRLAATARLGAWDRWPAAARRRELAALDAASFEFAARREASAGRPERAAEWRATRSEAASVPALPTGDAVLALGVPPGPLVGAVLRAVRARVDRDDVRDPAAIAAILHDEARRVVKADSGERR